MKETILRLIHKYNITKEKIIVLFLISIVLLVRFLAQNHIFFKPIQLAFNYYADFLIFVSKIILNLFKDNIVFDYINNQIISPQQALKIDLFYFSGNQIILVFIIALITKSPFRDKILFLLITFLIITIYNSIRISLHIIFPGTNSVHNWFFNLVLIPRWLLVVIFTYLFWNKFPALKEQIQNRYNLSSAFIKKTFIRIALIIVIYYLVVIITFNDFYIINGSLLISAVLNTSKFILELLGYDCWINNRLIYGTQASLYMDDSCIGIGLIFLFASFIVLLPGAIKHKLWFIPLGIIIIILLNCLRIILIFINLSNNGTYNLPLEIHDLYTYPVLIFTFFLWMIWINKFFKKGEKLIKSN